MRKNPFLGHVVLLNNGIRGVVGITSDAGLVVWHRDRQNSNPHPYPFTSDQVIKSFGRVAGHR